MKKLYILILFLFTLFNLTYAVGDINDLINHYNFSYQADSINLSALNYNLSNSTLIFQINLSSKIKKEYIFTYGTSNSFFSTKKSEKINLSKNNELKFNLSTLYFNRGNYSLYLIIEDDNQIIYRNENLINFNIEKQNSILNQTKIFSNQIFFLKQNISKSFPINLTKIKLVDQNNNKLIDFIELNLITTINQSNIYKILIILKDKYSNKIIKLEQWFNLTKGENLISFKINATQLYLEKIYPENLEVISIFNKENIILKSVTNIPLNLNISYLDFEKPLLSDLKIKTLKYNKTTGNLSLNIENIGKYDSFGFVINFLDNNFSSISEKIIPYLEKNNKLNLTYKIKSNLSSFFVYLDYYDFIEESNEENNILFWPSKTNLKSKNNHLLNKKDKTIGSGDGGSSNHKRNEKITNKYHKTEIKSENSNPKKDNKTIDLDRNLKYINKKLKLNQTFYINISSNLTKIKLMNIFQNHITLLIGNESINLSKNSAITLNKSNSIIDIKVLDLFDKTSLLNIMIQKKQNTSTLKVLNSNLTQIHNQIKIQKKTDLKSRKYLDKKQLDEIKSSRIEQGNLIQKILSFFYILFEKIFSFFR